MAQSQGGLGLVGALVIVALAVVALYYVYKGVTGEDGSPSCRSTHTECLKNCRRTRNEAPDLQRCQEACQRDAEECERRVQLQNPRIRSSAEHALAGGFGLVPATQSRIALVVGG